MLSPEELARFNDSSNNVPVVWLVPFLGMFVAIGSFMLGLGLRTKTVFPILFGGLFSGIPMLMALLVMFTVTLFTLAPLWLAMAVTGYRLGSREKWKYSFRPGMGGGKGSSGSGWVMGGGSSGGSSSGGSSGGSSSFGGGSSGGGGASGRW